VVSLGTEVEKDRKGVRGSGGKIIRLFFSAGALLALAPFLVIAAFILNMFAWAIGYVCGNGYVSLALSFIIIASLTALMIYTVVKAYQEAPKAAGYIYRFVKEDIEEFLKEARKYAEEG